MANLFGGWASNAASQREKTRTVEIDPLGDLEMQVRQVASKLVPIGRGVKRTVGSALLRAAKKARREAQRKTGEAEAAEQVLLVRIQRAPLPQADYVDIIKGKLSGQKPAPIASSAPFAATPEEYAAHCLRASGPMLVPAVKLAVHSLAAVGVFIVELSVLHAVLDVKFPPVLGVADQALGNGAVIAVFLVAVVAGYFAFRDCGERLEKVMRGIARIALFPFLIGFGLFAAGGISEGLAAGDATQLSMLASAATSGVTGSLDSIVAAIGNAGMAIAFSVVSLLSFVGLHGCITRIREHGTKVLNALGWRKEAREVAGEAKRISQAKAQAAEQLDDADVVVADAPRDAANWIASIVDPIAAAAESLLIQYRMSPAATVNVIPDVLSEQVANMNQDVLTEQLALLRQSADPDLIEADLRKTFKISHKKKGI